MVIKLGIKHYNDEKGKMTVFREMTEEEYTAYTNHARNIWDFSMDIQLYNIQHANYQELLDLLERYASDYASNPLLTELTMLENMSLEIDRLVLNYLSSFRTYLDHTETRLKRKYGKDSDEVARFKKECSKAYDEYFSYRLIYKLRNYCQHCGMPISKLNLRTKKKVHSLEVSLNSSELRSNFDSWGEPLNSELANMPLNFDLMEHITKTVEVLSQINMVILENDRSIVVDGAKYIKQVVNPLPIVDGCPIIVKLTEEIDPETKQSRTKGIAEFIQISCVNYILDLFQCA